jgi:hypothetical protein
MKKSLLLLFYILIIIFFGFLFYSFFIKHHIEGFSLDSSISSASSSISSGTSSISSATSSIGYYDYLTRLPPDNQWSSSTKKQLLDNMNSQLISSQPNATPMKSDSDNFVSFLQRYQAYATDNEVLYYIKNEKWPWNGYVNDYLKNSFIPILKKSFNWNDEQVDMFIKQLELLSTNRNMYLFFIMKQTVPQISIINRLQHDGIEPNVGTKLECIFLNKGEQTQPNQSKINIEEDGKYLRVNGTYTLDNNAWTTYIPGFVFQSKPCNVCQIIDYTDLSNNCLFTIETSEAFKKYMGDNSLTSSTSYISGDSMGSTSLTSSTNYISGTNEDSKNNTNGLSSFGFGEEEKDKKNNTNGLSSFSFGEEDKDKKNNSWF